MNIIADALTLIRGIIVLFILIFGVSWGRDALPQVVILTIICWLTDVLDGMLARKSAKPTRLGKFDLLMDLGLALTLIVCLALWNIVPIAAVIAVVLIVLISELALHFSAPRKFIKGLIYAGLLFAAWQISPVWAWVILGGLAFPCFSRPQKVQGAGYGISW